jgi:hypothetical protein
MKKNTSISLSILFIFIAAIGGLFFQKYDEWFKYPTLRAYVNDQLKDPASTQYRNEQLKKTGWLCGELNSKNSSGDYVGFRRYIAGSADDAYLEEHGYVGTDADNTSRVIENLDIRIAVLKKHNEFNSTMGTSHPLSESAINTEVTTEIFNEKWKKICE